MNVRLIAASAALTIASFGLGQVAQAAPTTVVVSAPGATFNNLGVYDTGSFTITGGASFSLFVNTSTAGTVDDFTLYSLIGPSTALVAADYDYTGNTLIYTYNGLASGNYQVVAQGTALSDVHVSYSISSAVPEADTYALALAGLAVAGAVMRRRTAR